MTSVAPVRRYARDWLTYLAGAGLVLVAFLDGPTWKGQETSARDHCNADYKMESAKPKPPGHRYNCYEHPTEEQHRTAEQFSWRNSLVLNVGIAIAAAFTVLFAAGTYWQTRKQTDIASKQLTIALGADRAWISPIGATVNNSPSVGEPLSLSVDYQNTGRSPALGMRENHLTGHVSMPDFANGEYPAIPENQQCIGLEPSEGTKVTYPASGGFERLSFEIKKNAVTQEMLSGKTLEYVQGCFAYLTSGHVHFSSFCFYLKPDPKQSIKGWLFEDCFEGNDAN